MHLLDPQTMYKIPDLQNIAAALNNLPEKYRDLAMQLLSIRDDQDEAEIMDLVMWDCEDEPRPKCLTSEEPNHKKYTELLAAAKEVCLNYKDTQDNHFNATEIAAFETSISELGELVGINRD